MSLSLLLIILLGSSSLVYLLSIASPLLAFNMTSEEKQKKENPMSILICARNEADNLSKYLPLIFAQKDVEFEVVIVDDASWDSTEDVLEELQASFPQLVVVKISEEQKRTAGKKMALTLGIKRAKYEHLLLTDADCEPESDQWAQRMNIHMQKGLVLGYGAYRKEVGFLNKLIRFDTWSSSSHFLGSALRGRPYIGVGRNMGYSKEIYEEAGGFKRHYHIMSGDDDLLVNQIANKDNCSVCIDEGSFTYTAAPSAYSTWLRVKTRHLTTSPLYKSSTRNMYRIKHGSLLLFYGLLIVCLALQCPLWQVLAVFIGKTLIQLLISMPSIKKLKETDLLALLPILEPVNLIINGLAIMRMKWSKTISWK